MDLSTFIIAVFCLVDDRLKDQELLRQCGPSPKLSGAELITIEIIGEFLGIDIDKALHRYFRRHYREWFPTLRFVHRTTFARGSQPLQGQGMPLAIAGSLLETHPPIFMLPPDP